MNAQFLNQWFTDQSIQAICWTLIHSVWIGIIASVLAGIIIATTRKSSPLLRYRLLCSVLILFVIATAITLNSELDPVAVKTSAQTGISAMNISPSSGTDLTIQRTFMTENLTGFLNRESQWIFAIWLICFALKSAQLISNMFYIRRVRHHKTHQIAEEWKIKVENFSRKLGIRRKVTLLQSELVKVPVTIGFLKPVILLPVGMVFQLATGQIDTILLHELAHIYRRDYLVNILQSIVEAIFFFNPAILWISALIREEREACCDDIVLENVTQKGNYLEALMAFHEHNSIPSGGLALALSLRKPQLMNRLRRMVNKENQRLTMFEMSVLLAGMLFLSAFTFIPEVKPGIENGVVYIKKAITQTLSVSTPEKGKTTPAKIVEPVAEQSIPMPADSIKFTSFRFNGSNGDRANKEMTLSDSQGNRYQVKVVNNALAALEINGTKIADHQLGSYKGLLDQINAAWDQTQQWKTNQGITAKAISDEKRRQEVAANELAYKNKFGKNPPAAGTKSSNQTPGVKSPGAVAAGSSLPQKKVPAAPDISADLERVRGVISVLIREKVIASQNDLESFGLTDTELTVNGKKQPDKLQKELKEAYGIRANYGLSYGPAEIKGGGIVIEKGDLK